MALEFVMKQHNVQKQKIRPFLEIPSTMFILSRINLWNVVTYTFYCTKLLKTWKNAINMSKNCYQIFLKNVPKTAFKKARACQDLLGVSRAILIFRVVRKLKHQPRIDLMLS